MLSRETSSKLKSNLITDAKKCPKLLVSVRDQTEAITAMLGGADWIDLKEPNRGPLGAVDYVLAKEAAKKIAKNLPMSAALGELVDWPESKTSKLLEINDIGTVKIGLAGSLRLNDWSKSWQSFASKVANLGKQTVAVAYADWEKVHAPSPLEIIDQANLMDVQYFLLDTYFKTSTSLLGLLSSEQLNNLIQAANSSGMNIVLAGGLNISSIDKLPLENVDVIAVRGAVCDEGRKGQVSAIKVSRLNRALSQCQVLSE